MKQYLIVIVFLMRFGYNSQAQQADSTKSPKWEYSLSYGLSAQETTRGRTLYEYQKFAFYPHNLPRNPNEGTSSQYTDYGWNPPCNVIELGLNYRFNNYFGVGLRSAYLFRNREVNSNSDNYKRFNQQLEAKINLNGEYEDQFNLIFFTQGSYINSLETSNYVRNLQDRNITASEGHRYKYFSHSLGIGLEWVEYFRNTWGYGICFKIGNDMQYRRSIEKTEYTLNGENLLPLLNKNQTSFIFKNEVPANANTNINEPTYAPRDFLPYAFAQLTLRFIYLR